MQGIEPSESTAALVTEEPLENRTTYKGKLIIFTSFYQSVASSRYTQSLVATAMVLERLGVKWDFCPVMGDFHIERAVNEAFKRFLDDPEVTDILTIDSDESWDVMGVLRLLAHPEPVVGCSYRMKNKWDQWTATLKTKDGVPVGKILPDGTALIEAERLPWGFLRLKREVLERYREHFSDLWFHGKTGKTPIYCQLQYINHELTSQDYSLSIRLKELGYQLWCDPNVTIGHYGMEAFMGNLHESLTALQQTTAADAKLVDAAKVVAEMAANIQARAA